MIQWKKVGITILLQFKKNIIIKKVFKKKKSKYFAQKRGSLPPVSTHSFLGFKKYIFNLNKILMILRI